VIDNTGNPPEPITLHGHAGVCRKCGPDGIVKMLRDPATLALAPDRCYCLRCGQPYYVVIAGPIDEWELDQWAQKGRA
jgi:hypothetical protein